jgi:hypothetical protein
MELTQEQLELRERLFEQCKVACGSTTAHTNAVIEICCTTAVLALTEHEPLPAEPDEEQVIYEAKRRHLVDPRFHSIVHLAMHICDQEQDTYTPQLAAAVALVLDDVVPAPTKVVKETSRFKYAEEAAHDLHNAGHLFRLTNKHNVVNEDGYLTSMFVLEDLGTVPT